jgi:hypothetical protein
LQRLFAEQKDNIAAAVPSGFSLADIPGLSKAQETLGVVGRTAGAAATDVSRRATGAAQSTSKSVLSWLFPLAALLLAAWGLWHFFLNPGRAARNAANNAVSRAANTADDAAPAVRNQVDRTAAEVTAMKPLVPDAAIGITEVREDMSGLFQSLNTAFSEIQDAPSAMRALPALRDINTKVDAMSQVFSRLPEASAAALRPVIEDQVNAATEKAEAVSSTEGIGAEVRALIQEIVAKITKWLSPINR